MHTLALHHFKKESRYNVYPYNRNNYKRRKTEQYEFNHALQETNYKNTISQYEFSQNLAALQNSHIRSPGQKRGPLLKFQIEPRMSPFIKLSIPFLIYLRHSAQKINIVHVDQTSNTPRDQE